MITTELVFVRHGEAHCNADGVVGGPATCTGLTDLGRSQVRAAAARLCAEHHAQPFTALSCGPRLRLQQTGDILADALHLPLITEPGLDGPIHGAADGKPWHEVKTAADGGPHAHPDTPWAKGSDTWNGYLLRAASQLEEIVRRHEGDRVVFAAHGETVIAAHTLLLPLPPGSPAGFTVGHASLTRWQHHLNRLGQRRWILDRHNDTAPPLLALARETLGGVEAVTDSALPPNLLRLRGADGRAYLVKQHTLPSRYVREVRAYRTWTRHLSGHAPELVACDDAHLALLLTALPGRNATGAENDEHLHHCAGAVLSVLHQATAASAFPGTGLAERLRDWTARAERARLVSRSERQYLTRSAALLANAVCDGAVCHLDYQPRNWLTGPDGFGVCDFEHSRYDARVRDFARLQFRHWLTAPHLRDAFFDGYGRHPSRAEYLLLETFGAIEAVTALVRGHERQDPDLSAHGRAILTHFS